MFDNQNRTMMWCTENRQYLRIVKKQIYQLTVQLFGAEHVPPFRHAGKQTAETIIDKNVIFIEITTYVFDKEHRSKMKYTKE